MDIVINDQQASKILEVLKEAEATELYEYLNRRLIKVQNNKIKKQIAKEAAELKEKLRIEKLLKSSSELAEKRRAELIQNQTESEKIFKAKLKAAGIIYEFQKIIYTDIKQFYIADFLIYIKDKPLIIELDGGYHNTKEQIAKDKNRTKNLNKAGFTVKRLTNKQATLITELELKALIKTLKVN